MYKRQTVDDVQIIDAITESRLKASGLVVTSDDILNVGIQSSANTSTAYTVGTSSSSSGSSGSGSSGSGGSGSGGSGSGGGGSSY